MEQSLTPPYGGAADPAIGHDNNTTSTSTIWQVINR